MAVEGETRVALVGAGPGDPGLLTLNAVGWLRRADLVLYDRLVPVRFLNFANHARHLCVDQLHSCREDRFRLVIETITDAAESGQVVVRLKGGDPFVFGRGGEEADALQRAGIAFEVVPGITAALGLACAGIPLSHRQHSSAVAFVTGHEQPAKDGSMLDWPILARFPGTLVFYMAMARLEETIEQLLSADLDPLTPAAVVRWATTNQQQTVTAPLKELATEVRAKGIAAPALLVVGSVVSLRGHSPWFESRPLFGRHVLVTRPRHQASGMVSDLERLGAVVSVVPTVEIREPKDWAPVDKSLSQLGSYQWLVFTSVNGIQYFMRRLRQVGLDLRSLGSLRIAVIGPATAEALRTYHLEPDLIPEQFCSESLAEALRIQARGQRVLLARADRGRDLLRDVLRTVAEVDQVAVYSQLDATEFDESIINQIASGAVTDVTLTSSNIARALIKSLTAAGLESIRSGQTRLITISPVTTVAVRELGLPVAGEAADYTVDGVIKALIALAVSAQADTGASRS